jgi:hypothetical protein
LQWTAQVPPFPSQLLFVQPYPALKPIDVPPAALHDAAKLSFETVLIFVVAAHASLVNKATVAIVIIAISLLRIEASFKKMPTHVGCLTPCFLPRNVLIRDSPDDSRTGANFGAFPAFPQD